MQKFELGYSIHDCGDGSVSVRFFPDRESALADEEKDREEGITCWGEPCASAKILAIVDGKICMQITEYKWDDLKKYVPVVTYVPLKEVA